MSKVTPCQDIHVRLIADLLYVLPQLRTSSTLPAGAPQAAVQMVDISWLPYLAGGSCGACVKGMHWLLQYDDAHGRNLITVHMYVTHIGHMLCAASRGYLGPPWTPAD